MSKIQPSKEELKVLISTAAILVDLKHIFYKLYPEGVKEFQGITELFDIESEEKWEAVAKELVIETVADLKSLIAKHNAV